MRIIFFGTPKFSSAYLLALIDDPDIEIQAVVTQPDKPAGRSGELTAPAIKELALEHKLELLQPKTLKSDAVADQLSQYQADAFVVVAYGKMIPKNILDLPKLGCINVHPSLLPKYRGPSPMQWAIAGGEVETGVTIMLLDEGMDTGPILAFEGIGIDDEETYQSLEKKVNQIGPRLLVETLKRHDFGEIKPMPQDESQASLTRMLERDDGRIDWNQTMTEIERKHRAYNPWPGSWSNWQRDKKQIRLKFIKLRPADFTADLPAGTVSIKNNQMFIDCSDGTLKILEIQPEGKPIMLAKAFLAGYPDINSQLLS